MFCHHCGRQLQVRCSNCSASNPDDSAFCHRCGGRLGDTPRATGPPWTGTTGESLVVSPPTAAQVSCPRCHMFNEEGSRFCYSCGLPLDGAPVVGVLRGPDGRSVGTPAGFWIRAGAVIIDEVILGVVMMLIALAMGVDPSAVPEYLFNSDGFNVGDVADLVVFGAYATIGWSVYGTTIGKRVFKLYVVRPDGARLSPGRALVRYLLTLLSGLLLGVGYLTVAFRTDKRALHDLIADTYVVRR